ncbi:Alpha/Beta hydrolase protein [Sporodiniella umbellata]|nr:Alpha/Beta hydrolase protein [Sporodiniella umbellata]
MVEIKPFGSWKSPITAESLTTGAPATDVCVDKNYVYWTEVVPSEEGRGQIFFKSLVDTQQEAKTLLPLGYNCRTRVHEYGGGPFTVKNGLLVFSNNQDSRLYTIHLDSPSNIQPLTKKDTLYRYADICIDNSGDFLICVREEHFENEEPKDVVNTLVSIDLKTGNEKVIAEGADFYSCPRLNSENGALAYIAWDHPNMPWDFTRLYYAKTKFVDEAVSIESIECIAGKDIEESITQLKFGIDGTLYFASDRTLFWNLYSYTNAGVDLLLSKALEQEFAGPAWRFNESTYSPLKSDAKKLICINGNSLAILDVEKKTLSNLSSLEKYEHFSYVTTYEKNGKENVIANMASTIESQQLLAVEIETSKVVATLKGPVGESLDPAYVSVGKEIAFPTTDGKIAYCYFYEPKNPNYQGEGLPPVRVLSHGGPTAQSSNQYSRSYQYWTSRGFALADVNYGGSTGYGRQYRNRLQRNWGVVDVDDCCNAALYLADQGLVDREKLAIEGGSAGGFTTLASVSFRGVFKAGCCKYGISDITLLAKETHKFESRYPDRLIGEYPKEKEIYEERSPLFSADKIDCPVIFFQGAEDKVVPPSQSEVMVKALKEKGIPVAYVLYEGEAHGFRRAENIKRTMEVEQWFYGQIFGFPVEGIEGVEIFNYTQNKA